MANQTPTEKAVSMAERIEQLEGINATLNDEINKINIKHQQKIEIYEAYQTGVKNTLEALLNRKVNL